MSMAMLLNAATAAESGRSPEPRARIAITSLLCADAAPGWRREPRWPPGPAPSLGKRRVAAPALRRSLSPASPARRGSSGGSSSGGWSDGTLSAGSSPARRTRAPGADDALALSPGPLSAGGGGPGSPRNAPRRRWKEDEDALLVLVVREHGPGRWNRLAEQFPGRNGRQVRLRWMNHLQPSLDKREWRPEEDDVLLEAHRVLGNKWALIAMKLSGRTDNSVKNRFKSLMRRRQRESRARPVP